MSDFLSSLKADLSDRRLLPFVAVVGLALLGALGYVVLGGGSGSTTPPATVGGASAARGIAVTSATANPAKPVAETTSGSPVQRGGSARNPFIPLPGAAKAKTAASNATSSTGTHSSSNTTSGGSSTGANLGSGSSPKTEPKATTPSPAPSPSKPSKPKPETVYHVSTLFGVVPAVVPPGGVQLTPYSDMRLLTALPSAKQPLIVFRGVTTGGKSAIFTVVGEAILRGNATCLPSTSQCLAIELKPGQVEQLEYLASSGEVVTYELRIVSITPTKASAAAVVSVRRASSNAGRAVLRRAGLLGLPGLRYSASVGVLALLGHPAAAARAHH
ncbi:MAG TPA: hypothetical protein VGN08_08850 [Solirubrobacteraceae bacterium]|jgi:hypothetical protein